MLMGRRWRISACKEAIVVESLIAKARSGRPAKVETSVLIVRTIVAGVTNTELVVMVEVDRDVEV